MLHIYYTVGVVGLTAYDPPRLLEQVSVSLASQRGEIPRAYARVIRACQRHAHSVVGVEVSLWDDARALQAAEHGALVVIPSRGDPVPGEIATALAMVEADLWPAWQQFTRRPN